MPPKLPTFDQLMLPTLDALRALGGSAGVTELVDEIAQAMQLSDEAMNFRRERASMNEVAYRAAWARTYLKRSGAIERTARGVWTLTPEGSRLTAEDVARIPAAIREIDRVTRAGSESAANGQDTSISSEQVEGELDIGWKAQLLRVLGGISPAAFERLAQRILRESGFVKVEVTGRSGDGGIDGIGVLRMRLISFQVLFQCKRYRDTVGAGEIRNFRGAMVGRSDKALFITTGRFTPDAQREATRDGAPPVELIDGETLCDLLKDLKIGVTTEMIETVRIQPEMFEAI